mmetsp:Transcript_6653/g.18579  ORF Transcript_6653/g.18579 Transcript_6653/m.18579 type:complete len:277 (+) Transcript_6653:511-1341(+)
MDGGLSPETCEANHCQSAVLDLDGATTSKLFGSLLGGEAKGIVESGDHVLSRNTATEVVLSSARVEELVMELNEASEKEHLGLAPAGDGIPGLEALGRDGGEINAGGELAGKAEAGADGPPADEGGHGDAAVLDLGVAEPGDGLVRSEVGEAEGIPLLAELDGVGLGEDRLAGHAGVSGGGGGRGGLLLGSLLGGGLLLGHEDGGGNAGGLGSRHEGRGGASKSSKGQERQLHFGYICITLVIYLVLLQEPMVTMILIREDTSHSPSGALRCRPGC